MLIDAAALGQGMSWHEQRLIQVYHQSLLFAASGATKGSESRSDVRACAHFCAFACLIIIGLQKFSYNSSQHKWFRLCNERTILHILYTVCVLCEHRCTKILLSDKSCEALSGRLLSQAPLTPVVNGKRMNRALLCKKSKLSNPLQALSCAFCSCFSLWAQVVAVNL